ncbi:hypothetical protein BJ138DRAFT_1153417 [Hygrophoropsis aurantiaca]|uniref:Uncharacterized protein n=1 Tax=Hygrophoropsis aurantiaca TaxID=72124 RepID=A0ACB8AAI0_9AGAM|nr:hypothetical protein BJ138DRAFT_1153417 [Hygrophoropsis aurantiaca]
MGNRTGHHDNTIRTAIKAIEDEVLELKKEEDELLTRLRLLQDTITHKRALARNLKSSLVLVNRLPNEILLMCFGQVVQDWVDRNAVADERIVAFYEWAPNADHDLPCTLSLAISHVSHRWRQLAINTPSLWTDLVITPNFERHLDVFQDFLHRADIMPIAANFHPLGPGSMLSSTGVLLTEAIMQLIHMQQINELTFLGSDSVLSCFPPSMAFNRLTALRISGNYHVPELTFSYLRRLLSATPQLKTLELQLDKLLDVAEDADEAVITFPMLENLTVIEPNPFVCKLLDSLSCQSAPGLRQLKFPMVRNLTLSCSLQCDRLETDLIHAFPRVTHLTVRSPSLFYKSEEPGSLATPAFQCLQQLTFDFCIRGRR